MQEVQYLKKLDTPDWDYHIATPILLQEAARLKKLFPYDPATKKFIGMNGNLIPEHVSPAEASPENLLTEPVLVGGQAKEPVVGRIGNDSDAPPDPNRVALIQAAIPGLDTDKEWTKANSQRPAMPRVDALNAILGIEITREERDAAFSAYIEQEKK